MSFLDNNSGKAGKEDRASLVKQVAASLGRMLELTSLSTEWYIYRVPEKLRKVKSKAYTPRVVSIGPLHHGEEHLVAMEKHKLRYLRSFLSKSGKSLEECVEILSKEEKRTRDCYMDSINMCSEDFVKMILVDGCFAIEVMLGFWNWNRRTSKPDDRIYNKPWLLIDVRRDMTLLENQLPFFLLFTLYSLLPLPTGHRNHYYSFLLFSVEFFKDCLQIPEAKSSEEIMTEIAKKTSRTNDQKVKHFVELLILCQQPSSPRLPTPENFNFVIPTATQLYEAGVRFKLGSKHKSLLDIDYISGGVLEIPSLILEEKCESMFRNLVAFEQCHSHVPTYITDYMYLMGHLIKTTRDVDLLVGEGIIGNHLGDSVAVKNLFDSLLIETRIWKDTFYFAGIYDKLNKYCESPWNEWKETLRHEYFSSPWRGASTFAAVILLVLTFIVSYKPYFHGCLLSNFFCW